jgi:hypothetical protein
VSACGKDAPANEVPAIEAEGLTKRFGDFVAVDDVSVAWGAAKSSACSAPTAAAARPAVIKPSYSQPFSAIAASDDGQAY